MSTESVAVDPEVVSDAEAVLAALAAGEKVDTVILRRIQERSQKARERVLQEHGPLNIAVHAIRELRNS